MLRFSSSSSGAETGRGGSLLPELFVEKDLRSCGVELEEVSTLMKSEETKSNTQWTDEKHSLYLNSMEASFVDQLYDSLDKPFGQKSSMHTQNGICNPSGQFKVFKDGYWERINFSNLKRDMPRLKKIEKSDQILANPWIQHYRSLGRHHNRISPSLRKQAPGFKVVESSNFQFRSQNSFGSNAEGTDQNFVDEVPEEEKPSSIHRQKCRKLSAASGLSNDQVVPFAKLSLTDNPADGSPE